MSYFLSTLLGILMARLIEHHDPKSNKSLPRFLFWLSTGTILYALVLSL